MRVKIDGGRATLCDGCGTRLDGPENANKSLASYGSQDDNGRFVPRTNICRTNGTDCLWAWRSGLTEDEAVAAYRAEQAQTREDDHGTA